VLGAAKLSERTLLTLFLIPVTILAVAGIASNAILPTLIAEAPEPACSVDSRDRAAIKRARLAAQDVVLGEKVIAAGVGFFDFAHNQTGHAANYIELHPLLSIQRLRAKPQ